MHWILYALLGAVTQAIEMAVKKKTLQVRGANNLVGALAMLSAGLFMFALYFFEQGTFLPQVPLSMQFWLSTIVTTLLNIVGAWFLYRAIDMTELSYLMPFMTLTSLSIMIPPIIFLREIPTMWSIVGIVVVMLGALFMDYRSKGSVQTAEEIEQKRVNRKAKHYFLVTALCYTFTPTTMKIAVVSGGAVFTSALVSMLMFVGFLALIFVLGETKRSGEVLMQKGRGVFFLGVTAAGLAIALSQWGISSALLLAPVAYVMSVKRLMPMFAFGIGYLFFHERTNVLRKLTATLVMISGALIITFSG
jgi:drug/metabolite transporter (DMT)-like permease